MIGRHLKESSENEELGVSSIGQRRKWHPTPVPSPGKSHERRSLVGCSPWGRKESDTTERLHITSIGPMGSGLTAQWLWSRSTQDQGGIRGDQEDGSHFIWAFSGQFVPLPRLLVIPGSESQGQDLKPGDVNLHYTAFSFSLIPSSSHIVGVMICNERFKMFFVTQMVQFNSCKRAKRDRCDIEKEVRSLSPTSPHPWRKCGGPVLPSWSIYACSQINHIFFLPAFFTK